MRAGRSICGLKGCSFPPVVWWLVLALLLAAAGPATAREVSGRVDAGGFGPRANQAGATSLWAVEVRSGDRVWPGLLLGSQGQIWARLPGLSGPPIPPLVARHSASRREALVSAGRKLPLASGNGDWWVLEGGTRGWVDQAPPAVSPGSGQALWVYTFSPRRDRLVRNTYPARSSGGRLYLVGEQAPALGLVTDQRDRVVGLLAGPGELTSLAQAQEVLAATPALSVPNPPTVTPITADEASTTTTTLPPPTNPRESKEDRGMPEYVRVILGLILAPVAAWLMGFMVFRATWGKLSPYKGVAIGMAVFWLLVAVAEYGIWVGSREPREALLQASLSLIIPSLLSWPIILLNLFRRLRD